MIYSAEIAKQYKCYRPALHNVILNRCLETDRQYALAVDIGCGVGHSSDALRPYCQRIIGIDNSDEMLALAPKYDNITFEKSTLPDLANADDSVDLITFAGSLIYCKSQELLNECVRVLHHKGEILIYDFYIQLDKIILVLLSSTVKSDYDHSINFSGLDISKLSHLESTIFRDSIHIDLSNLIHLLRADQKLFSLLQTEYTVECINDDLMTILNRRFPEGSIDLDAELYYSLYSF